MKEEKKIDKKLKKFKKETNELKEELINFVLDNYKEENVITDYKKGDLHINIYLPELKLGFKMLGLYENSLQYSTNKAQLQQLKYAKERDIHLVQIFSDEWINKNNIVKSKIKHQLKLHKKSIYARECEVRLIESNEKNIFLEDNHIQGKDTSGIKYGLYYDNELVSIMTLSKPRLNLGIKKDKIKDGMYELSRFASLKNYNVIGAFGKLLKHIIRNENVRYIKTYADLRYTDQDNNVYLKNGFKLHHISEPSYFYTTGEERINRFNFRKQELEKRFPDHFSKEKTEKQICNEAGYYAVYDCGALCLELFVTNKKKIAKKDKTIEKIRNKLGIK